MTKGESGLAGAPGLFMLRRFLKKKENMYSSIRLLATVTLFSGAFCSPAMSEENPANVVSVLSSTTISGYVNGGTHWQPRAATGNPVAGVIAIRPTAREGKLISRTPRSGAFKFFRGGDISRPLPVYFLVDGAATAGVDFVASSGGKTHPIVSALQPAGGFALSSAFYGGGIIFSTGTGVVVGPPIAITNLWPPIMLRPLDSIVIPAGRRSVTLTIDPIDDRRREMAESVVISITSNGEGYPSRAAVHIIDND